MYCGEDPQKSILRGAKEPKDNVLFFLFHVQDQWRNRMPKATLLISWLEDVALDPRLIRLLTCPVPPAQCRPRVTHPSLGSLAPQSRAVTQERRDKKGKRIAGSPRLIGPAPRTTLGQSERAGRGPGPDSSRGPSCETRCQGKGTRPPQAGPPGLLPSYHCRDV